LAILAITKTDDSLIAPFLILFYQKLKIKKAFFSGFFLHKTKTKNFYLFNLQSKFFGAILRLKSAGEP